LADFSCRHIPSKRTVEHNNCPQEGVGERVAGSFATYDSGDTAFASADTLRLEIIPPGGGCLEDQNHERSPDLRKSKREATPRHSEETDSRRVRIHMACMDAPHL
jgi:hypothetical protein